MVRPAPPTSPGATHTAYAHHELRRVNFTVMARKASPASPKTWPPHKPALCRDCWGDEDGRARAFHQGTRVARDPHDAGYMAATASSPSQRGSSCTAGRTIYEGGLLRRTCFTSDIGRLRHWRHQRAREGGQRQQTTLSGRKNTAGNSNGEQKADAQSTCVISAC